MAATTEDNPLLAPLRPDLQLFPGPPEEDGAPTYNLHDPLTGDYHKIGWAEATVLGLLRKPIRLRTLMERVRSGTTLEVSDNDVLQLCRQAAHAGLTVGSTVREVRDLLQERAAKKQRPLKWLLFHYLYFRVPLLYPEHFLRRTLPVVRRLASRPARWLYAILFVFGLYFVVREPLAYARTFLYFFNLQGLVLYGLAIAVLKAIHEFSHAYTATALGVRVRSMGIAFMIFAPIPFCDVTDAWRLPQRKKRAYIGVAGMCAEIVVAGVSLFLWGITEPGIAHSLFFLFSSASLLSTLIVNLNPAMRFDGYYILSDIWGIDNLQPRAFAMTRWWLHRALIGLDIPPPEENVPSRRLAGMVAYSIYAWIYRVFLYVGIAVLIYYKFTKLLGLVLFSAEIGLFLVRPIVQEARYLMAVRNRLRFNPRFVITGLVLLAVTVWLVLPMPQWAALPAVAVPQRHQVVYAPAAGRVVELNAAQGRQVRAGDLLVRLENEARLARIAILKLEQARLERETRRLGESEEERKYLPRNAREIASVKAQLDELREMERGNRILARLDGEVYAWNDHLGVGDYVQANAVFGRVATPGRLHVVAYAPEDRLGSMRNALETVFVPRAQPRRFAGAIKRINTVREQTLSHPVLGSEAGGDIPVVPNGNGQLLLRESYYRIEASLPEAAEAETLRFGQSGLLWVRLPPSSRIVRYARGVGRVLLQESGF
ncbi:MAG: site-2 protease family protein [Planctomycetota bacterium]